MEETGTVLSILNNKGRDVFSIEPGRTVFEAIQLLAERNIGALVVLDEGRLAGVFSERDYTRKVALQGRSSKETLVREVITGRVVTVTPKTSIPECMELMTQHRIRHLPVMEDERVVGMLSIGDLVNWIIHSQRATIQQLHSYIAGGYPG